MAVDPDGRAVVKLTEEYQQMREVAVEVRAATRERLGSIPFVGPTLATVADVLLSSVAPVTNEELNDAVLGMAAPIGAIKSGGRKVLGLAKEGAEELLEGRGGKWTKEVLERKTPGVDGASSRHILEKLDGRTNSVAHQVTKDGQVIHQHQTHVGKHGTQRQFPDELVEYPKVPEGGQ